MSLLSVVSPVYLAEGCIEELYRRLSAVLRSMEVDYEIVLVDDGSPDRSGDLITAIARKDPKVTALRLSRNFGQHPAITAGLMEAKGEWIVVMDCDLQDRPEDIPVLHAKAREGWDIVFARRRQRKDSPFKRGTSRLWFATLNRLSDISIDPATGSFSIISRQVANEFLQMCDRHRHYLLILRWLGFRQAYVDVEQAQRFAGRSSYTLRKLISHAVSGVASHSTRLLYISIYVGLFFVTISISQFLYVVFMKIFYRVGVAGWASLMATVWLIGGVILFSLGVLGIYLGRIFEQVKQRPLFIVRDRISSKTTAADQ